ncbi:MAG TPA: histidine phosphatase family protein [Bryobacteraceae bacterium]|nr:histidine phosphatase family protein [Bryobacteraceae bacterium]
MEPSSKGRFILVRHGETDANRRRCFADSDSISLSEAGVQQAREVALLLSDGFGAQVLVSSHFLRARQTAEIIAEVLSLETEAISGIHERDFGCLKGHPYERLGELMTRCDDTPPWLWKPEGGESLEDVRRRAVLVMENLRDRYSGQDVVIVCHGAVIQAICAHITGVWTESAVPPNCGFVTIEYDAGKWSAPVLSCEWDRITHSAG